MWRGFLIPVLGDLLYLDAPAFTGKKTFRFVERVCCDSPGTYNLAVEVASLYPVECLRRNLSMIECIRARDYRLTSSGSRWFGDYETPAILSKQGSEKIKKGLELDTSVYGRKESEGRDYNEDTNFGKLKRIPYKPLQEFLRDGGSNYSARGDYPAPWRLS